MINFFTKYCMAFIFVLSSNAVHAADAKKKEADQPAYQLLPTVISFFDALRIQHLDVAYASYTSTDFQKSTSLQQFLSFVKKYDLFEKNRTFLFHSFYIEGKIATFEGSLVSLQGIESPIEVDLVNETGKWKIRGLQLFQTETTVPRPYEMSNRIQTGLRKNLIDLF